jgi:two-component system phosphate regulon sensor histidine kinase PhoR
MKKRLSIALIIIIVSSITLCGLFTTISYRQSYFANTEMNIKKSGDYILNYLMPNYRESGNSDELSHYADTTDLRLTIINDLGVVIYESFANIDDLENHKNRPEIAGALEGDETTEIRYSNTIKDQMIYVAIPYFEENQVQAILRIALPLNAMEPVLYEMVNNVIFIMLATLLITIILITFFINRELKPLEEASAFAKKIAKGKYGEQLTMIRDDKIGDLVESLNQMSCQLETSFTEMNHKNIELSSILSSMNHGVIAVNEDNHIILINQAAREILKIHLNDDVVGKNILEVYRGSFVLELMENLKENESEKMSFESRINNEEYIKIYINQMKNHDNDSKGHIIIIEDITLIKSLENMRRDFVANVSHELKTPITTIKGFIETIQENEIKDEQTLSHFYSIILEESDRLTRLVNDILILSQLENKDGRNEIKEEVDVCREITHVFDILKLNVEEKNIRFMMQRSEPIFIVFNSDEFRQMMLNLLDNAIKYSEINKNIEIIVIENEMEIIIKVKDQGFGIPKKDVSRIFERFYRVEKSRSKEKGGTGLGLAIVKHVIQNNKGRIEVESNLGKGTCFTISFPK